MRTAKTLSPLTAASLRRVSSCSALDWCSRWKVRTRLSWDSFSISAVDQVDQCVGAVLCELVEVGSQSGDGLVEQLLPEQVDVFGWWLSGRRVGAGSSYSLFTTTPPGRRSRLPPDAFERLSMRLLREADFDSVRVTGGTNDKGIDGVGVYRLGLVTFPVFFQCKRYRGPVGSAAVRDFRGAMAGRRDKGLLITTSTSQLRPSGRQTAKARLPSTWWMALGSVSCSRATALVSQLRPLRW